MAHRLLNRTTRSEPADEPEHEMDEEMTMIERRKARAAGGESGFSLAELLIVIALMGLMILFGGPALGQSLRAYKVRSSANELTTIIRAIRYTAVTERTPVTLTLNDQADATNPNTYSYIDRHGKTVLVRLQSGVSMETSSVASITLGINGSTGQTSPQNVVVSMWVSDDRGDRYTIAVSPSGTVSSSYSTYTP